MVFILLIKIGGKMTKEMMKEILDDWMSWKYDIWESNTSTWTVRDDSKIHMIGVILEEKMKELEKYDYKEKENKNS